MDATAHARTTSPARLSVPASLLTLLLLLCTFSSAVVAARDDTELSPGIAELLRGTPSRAIPLLEQEAAAGDGRAAAYLAVARHYGWGTPINDASAIALARQAEAAGYAPASLFRYLEFESPSSEHDLKKAKSATERIARRGDSLAEFYFGMASIRKIGAGAMVEGLLVAPLLGPDDASARTLPQMREDPDYVSSTTTKYLRKADTGGFTPARYLLGAFSLKSATDVADVGEAVDLLHAAATREFAPAAVALAQLIENGLVVDPALKEGGPAIWYERAAALGDPDAMHELAMLHIKGEGVPKDLERAQMLLEQAVSLGSTDSAEDLEAVRYALRHERSHARRLQEQRDTAELQRRAWERAARAEQERQLALAAASTTAATDASQDATSDARATAELPATADPSALGAFTTESSAADLSSPAPAPIDVPDADPSLSQLYGVSLPWLILKLLGLLLLAEAVRRIAKFSNPWLPAFFAGGYSSDLPGFLKTFGIGFAALWLLSLAPVYYGLVAYLLWDDYRSRIADVRLARDVAKTQGALALEPGEIADAARVALITAPDWSPGGALTVRVRNDDGRADLAVLTTECAFQLRNGQESHHEQFVFELRPPLPAGFGTLVEARSKPTLQYENSDYQHRANCYITSALLRTPSIRPQVRIVSVRHDGDCKFNDSPGNGCLRFRIANSASTAIDGLEIRCIAGHDPVDVRWKDFSYFRREFARKEEPLVLASTTTEVIARADGPPWPDGSSPRCDVTDVDWQ